MGGYSAESLTLRIEKVRADIGYGTILKTDIYEVLDEMILVLEGKLLVDKGGFLHPPCAHDGATKLASQCCKCGNVIKVVVVGKHKLVGEVV